MAQPGFFVSSTIFFSLNKLFPVPGMGEYDEVDFYGTLTSAEADKLGIVRNEQLPVVHGDEGSVTEVSQTFEKKDESVSA